MCRQQIVATKDMDAGTGWMYEFGATRFAELAASMGALSFYVDKEKDLAVAIRDALASNRPALVEVVTDIASDPQKF